MDKINAIRKEIVGYEKTLIHKFPMLRAYDVIGLSALIASCLGIITSISLYFNGLISAWVVFFFNAFLMSILHELEHDLIHKLYFKNHTWVSNSMMLICWIFKPTTINPWIRRNMHINHHAVSGEEIDIEERLLGNGMKYGFKRLMILVHNSFTMLNPTHLNFLKMSRKKIVYSGLPFHVLSLGLIFISVGFYFLNLFYFKSPNIPPFIHLINMVLVSYILPDLFRQFSLGIITSSMHYINVDKDLMKQTQILDHWIFIPFQLFCFNFGKTHSSHHFVISQPFFIRALIAKQCVDLLEKNGVRRNDFGTFRRQNTYS